MQRYNTCDLWIDTMRHLRYLEGWWMDGWMDGWMGWMQWRMDAWMYRWMGGRMNGWTDGWTDEWMDGWMGGWMDGRMDGRIDRWIYFCFRKGRSATPRTWLPYVSDRRNSWVSRLTWSCRFKLSVFVAFSASSDVLSLSWRSASFANSCSLTRRISAPFRWQSSILSRSTTYFRSPLKASRYSWIAVHGKRVSARCDGKPHFP